MTEGAGTPGIRQRAEQLHPVSFAGEQHFTHSGRTPEIKKAIVTLDPSSKPIEFFEGMY